MKATEQYFPVVLRIILYKSILSPWIKSYSLTIQMYVVYWCFASCNLRSFPPPFNFNSANSWTPSHCVALGLLW